jgi:hypothetical protein
VYIRNSVLSHERPAGRCWNPAGTASCVVLTVYFLCPPNFYWSDMWRELDILSPEEQFFSTQCRCHLVLWHTGSHRIVIVINCNIISLLHLTLWKSNVPDQPRKVWWTHVEEIIYSMMWLIKPRKKTSIGTIQIIIWKSFGQAFQKIVLLDENKE